MMKYILILTLIVSNITLNAQDNVWTLQECLQYALENNLNLKRSKLTLQGSEITLKQSKYDLLPNLNANGSYGYNWGRSIDPTTNQFIAQRINFTSLGASTGVSLFNGGRLRNTLKQSIHDVNAAEYDYEAAKIDLMFNIVSLYTNVVFNQELVQNAASQVASTEQQLKRITKQVEAGAIPRSDLLDMEAQHASNELNLINQKNSLDLSLLQLKQALQLPASNPFEVIVPEELDVDPLTEPALAYTAEEIYQQTEKTLPQLQSAKERIESAELGVDVAKGSLYPRIDISAGLSSNYSDAYARFSGNGTFNSEVIQGMQTANGEAIVQLVPGGNIVAVPFSDQLEENLSKFISFGINIPVFNGFSARHGIQRAVINQEQAEINLQETRNVVRQEIETAYNDVIAAAKSYAAAKKQVSAREEAFRMTERRYELGATTFIDYQLSENQLFQSRSDLLRAKYDYIFKTKVLDFYLGNPLEF